MQSSTVYVGNLDSRVDRELLYELFVQAGPVSSIKLPKEKNITQEQLQYAFVRFENSEDMAYSCKLFDNKISLFGKTIKVRKSNHRNEAAIFDTGAKLFVKNVDESVDATQLANIFKKFGSFSKQPEIFYLKDGTLRCAYIYYKTFKDSDKALEQVNGSLLANKVLTVDYAYKDDKKRGAKHGDEMERLLDDERQKHMSHSAQ